MAIHKVTRVRYVTVNGTTQQVYETVTEPHWALLALKKETGGQVVFGTDVNLLPVGGGLGAQLLTERYSYVLVAPETQIYIASQDAQAISIIVTSLPFLHVVTRFGELLEDPQKLARKVIGVLTSVAAWRVAVMAKLRGKGMKNA